MYMSTIAIIQTSDGQIPVEIENIEHSEGLESASVNLTTWAFDKILDALKLDAAYVIEKIKDLPINEIEIAYGIKVGMEIGGGPVFFLAKGSSEGAYTITLKWQRESNP